MDTLKKTLLIGGSSDIGKEIKLQLIDHSIVEINSKDLDLADLSKVKKFTTNFIPDNIVFLAALNKPKRFIENTNREISNAFNVNFFSLVFILKYFLKKILKKKKSCNIVLITSLYSQKGRENRFLYSVSKHALLGIVRNLAVEYGRFGIKVNAISPGFVSTKMTNKNLSKNQISKIKKTSPNRSLVEKKEVAEILKFILDSKSKNLNGQEIVVDAGISIDGSFGL
jgi:NAD(P)-dependent dehydrogenase (short-subunit alcohol dehydrogenase family)